MKKVIKIEVDCAVCANKIQEAVAKVEGVNSVTVKKAIKIAKKVEPDFEVIG